jgi:hypothetical protein
MLVQIPSGGPEREEVSKIAVNFNLFCHKLFDTVEQGSIYVSERQ